jgi:hypothetical protein
MRASSTLFASLLLVAGCSSTPKVAVRPDLPPLPGALAARCTDVLVKPGNPIVELARQRQALANCARRQHDTAAFYEDLRRGLQ